MEKLEYWLQWQVLICSLIIILPTTIALNFLRKKGSGGGHQIKSAADLWSPCWRNLHPRWLLFYRAFSLVVMAFLLYQTVASFGFFVFFFYTQWTFALVMVYFALATVVSIRGCRSHSKKPVAEPREQRDRFLKKNSEEVNDETNESSNEKESLDFQVGYVENLLLIVYPVCAGAVMLTDIVFWCLLLPFMTGENFKLTLLIGCMHSVNAIFLLIESALNRIPFSWFGIIYFLLWSVVYVVVQWALHACCFTWWPYPFLDLSTPFAPLWYLALALVHVPCYGLYLWLVKAKNAAFSRMFPHTFLSVSIHKKGI